MIPPTTPAPVVYPPTALDPDATSVARMRARLLAGPGAGAFEPMIEAYRRAADGVCTVAADLSWLLGQHDAAHGGRAAQAVRARLEELLADGPHRSRHALAVYQDNSNHTLTTALPVFGRSGASRVV